MQGSKDSRVQGFKGPRDPRVQGIQCEKIMHSKCQLLAYLLSLSFPLVGNPSEKPSERFRPSRNDSNGSK